MQLPPDNLKRKDRPNATYSPLAKQAMKRRSEGVASANGSAVAGSSYSPLAAGQAGPTNVKQEGEVDIEPTSTDGSNDADMLPPHEPREGKSITEGLIKKRKLPESPEAVKRAKHDSHDDSSGQAVTSKILKPSLRKQPSSLKGRSPSAAPHAQFAQFQLQVTPLQLDWSDVKPNHGIYNTLIAAASDQVMHPASQPMQPFSFTGLFDSNAPKRSLHAGSLDGLQSGNAPIAVPPRAEFVCYCTDCARCRAFRLFTPPPPFNPARPAPFVPGCTCCQCTDWASKENTA